MPSLRRMRAPQCSQPSNKILPESTRRALAQLRGRSWLNGGKTEDGRRTLRVADLTAAAPFAYGDVEAVEGDA